MDDNRSINTREKGITSQHVKSLLPLNIVLSPSGTLVRSKEEKISFVTRIKKKKQEKKKNQL